MRFILRQATGIDAGEAPGRRRVGPRQLYAHRPAPGAGRQAPQDGGDDLLVGLGDQVLQAAPDKVLMSAAEGAARCAQGEVHAIVGVDLEQQVCARERKSEVSGGAFGHGVQPSG